MKNQPICKIRLATPEDVSLLQAIEIAAGALFSQYEFTADLNVAAIPVEDFVQAQKDNLLWVAAMPGCAPIGFALVHMLDGAAHLQEVDVRPEFGRQGIGAKLVRAVCEWAQTSEIPAVTLTTFREIPWNAPFYQKLGFRILAAEELTPSLSRLVEDEERQGLKRELRVVMRYET